ncbi:hypothetical protein SLEP1_g40080 [Rubroshorea leprosula]|uniref:Uncharacterized protein n=1 Tax=Rubroshorea leprosula TaxID=152421 RepID=A0AAV5L2B7_9ROSI|nr:hypothetical protein SLEP1_g40080 [Rubroshorea leprosula]
MQATWVRRSRRQGDLVQRKAGVVQSWRLMQIRCRAGAGVMIARDVGVGGTSGAEQGARAQAGAGARLGRAGDLGSGRRAQGADWFWVIGFEFGLGLMGFG